MFSQMFLKTAWSSHQAFLHKRRRKKEKLVHPYSLMNGRIGRKTWRAHQKSPKNLGVEQRSEMGSQTSWNSVGSPLLGPELKSKGWLPPKLALKSGRNSWCCFISGPVGKEAHSLWAWQEHKELTNNMDKINELSLKYLLLATFMESSFPCYLYIKHVL